MNLSQDWAIFYAHTVIYDKVQIEVEQKELVATFVDCKETLFWSNHRDLCSDAILFGTLMEQVMKGEDNYPYPRPCGTECRTWCRTFNALKYPKGQYKGYFSFVNFDWHSAVHKASLFSKHSTIDLT